MTKGMLLNGDDDNGQSQQRKELEKKQRNGEHTVVRGKEDSEHLKG